MKIKLEQIDEETKKTIACAVNKQAIYSKDTATYKNLTDLAERIMRGSLVVCDYIENVNES